MSETSEEPPYGPNTHAVRRFLQYLAARSAEECASATLLYAELQRQPTFEVADRALAAAILSSGREKERDAVVGPLVQLLHEHPERLAQSGAAHAPTIEELAEAALGAALAIIARDAIADDAFETLYGPFAELIPAELLLR